MYSVSKPSVIQVLFNDFHLRSNCSIQFSLLFVMEPGNTRPCTCSPWHFPICATLAGSVLLSPLHPPSLRESRSRNKTEPGITHWTGHKPNLTGLGTRPLLVFISTTAQQWCSFDVGVHIIWFRQYIYAFLYRGKTLLTFFPPLNRQIIKSLSTSQDKPRSPLPRNPSLCRARKKNLGYCECCHEPFKDQDEVRRVSKSFLFFCLCFVC